MTSRSEQSISAFLKAGHKTFVYELWFYAKVLHARKISHLHWTEATRRYQHNFDFTGRTARYVMVTNDPSITRGEALKMATAIAQNKVVAFSIDTSDL